jgi:hypothetical protein
MSVVDSRVRNGALTVGGEVFSCQPTNVNIAPDHSGNTEDPVEVLCGDTITDTGGQTLTATLNITSIQDFTNADGLIGYAWANDGTEQDFVWQPTDDPTDSWTGKVTVQAITVGGDVAARLTSDAAWPTTQLTMPEKLGGKTVIGSDSPSTGATAGTPGSWTPSGSNPPADAAGATAAGVVASPTTAWTTGQYVQGSTSGTAGETHWDGAAWAAGMAP